MKLTFKDLDKKLFPELEDITHANFEKEIPKIEKIVKERKIKLSVDDYKELFFKKNLDVLKEFDPKPLQPFGDKSIWTITVNSIIIIIKFSNYHSTNVFLQKFDSTSGLITKNPKELRIAINCWLRNR